MINLEMSRREAYREFRTGLNYHEVWQELKGEQKDGLRRWVTRHTVLGRWRQIKLQMFAEIDSYFG
jgi:hypothetical protein